MTPLRPFENTTNRKKFTLHFYYKLLKKQDFEVPILALMGTFFMRWAEDLFHWILYKEYILELIIGVENYPKSKKKLEKHLVSFFS